MNQSWSQTWQEYKESFINYWQGISRKQKTLIIGTFVFILVALTIFTYVASKPQYIPLYTSELTPKEIGQIKAELDGRGYTNYQLAQNGTTILVPKKDAPDLIVQLAAQGIPQSGSISYEVFSENMTFGATDRQLDVIEREALQNELAMLIKRIDGIKNAEVMVTLPSESVFIRPGEEDQATASIVVEVDYGHSLTNQQIRALYYLVSRSVPKLPIENIVIMDQYSQLLDLQELNENDINLADYERQRKIRQDVERDIQRNLQSMLGTIMGPDKVFVHTFVKLNFDKVTTQESLVQPVDKENNEGIAISVEKVTKTFNGEAAEVGGIIGTGETDVPGYPGGMNGGNSEYEELQNRVNYEINRISREIIQSPYQIEDITINVGVEPPDPNDPDSLTPETQENIRNILSNVVRTALGPEHEQADMSQRITVFPRAFSGKPAQQAESPAQQAVLYGLIAAVVLLLAGGVWIFLQRRKRQKEQEELALQYQNQSQSLGEMLDIKVEETEETITRKKLEKMAKQNPEDFVKLLRSWVNEERE
jgi:flagellar M-ring protein FliF